MEASWDEAMGRVASTLARPPREKGPLSHGFYTSGQLMLEEYYTLAVIGKAGIGTPHMDGNTRLCTATAAASLKESFGTDGQPGCYADLDHCDVVFHFGHNVAATQTVMWARMLDRLYASDPPRHVTVDPRVRRSPSARRCISPSAREPTSRWSTACSAAHRPRLGRRRLRRRPHQRLRRPGGGRGGVPAGAVADICGVKARDVEAAAEIFGTGDAVVSTVLQGFYQSHQATAAAVGVNNLHLLRGSSVGTVAASSR